LLDTTLVNYRGKKNPCAPPLQIGGNQTQDQLLMRAMTWPYHLPSLGERNLIGSHNNSRQ